MRESIGTSFMLNFIILFIFLVFAFLAGTFSYYKAYRINNYIVNAIEKYEGYNEYSRAEIEKGLTSLAYDITTKTDCPDTWTNSSQTYLSSELSYNKVTGVRVLYSDSSDGQEGYCVYLYWNDNAAKAYRGNTVETTDIYYTYGVLTYMRMRFPVVENVLRIPIFSRTNRMYYFG
jgi:hypothetical protein